MAELKKCPFCGGEAELYQYYPYLRKRCLSTVRCKSCRANSGTWGRKDKAIESWNNRATEAELRANVIDEFAEALKKICAERPLGTDREKWIPLYVHEDGTWHSLIDDVVAQMKGEKE